MIAFISKFEIENGMEDEVKIAIKNWLELVEHAKVFVKLMFKVR